MNYVDVLRRDLDAHGITEWSIDRTHRHPRLMFTVNGQRKILVFPNTPSDRRGHLNARADLRRMLNERSHD